MEEKKPEHHESADGVLKSFGVIDDDDELPEDSEDVAGHSDDMRDAEAMNIPMDG